MWMYFSKLVRNGSIILTIKLVNNRDIWNSLEFDKEIGYLYMCGLPSEVSTDGVVPSANVRACNSHKAATSSGRGGL